MQKRRWPNVPVDENGLSTRRDLALDNIYNNKFVEFHMANGTILNSRDINWRHVMWDQVVKLVISIRGIRHEVNCVNKTDFKCFLNFRTMSNINTPGPDGKYGPTERIHRWIIGWTDGKKCYLDEVCFHTGQLLRRYYKDLDDGVLGHVHPRCRAGLENV